jgi:hypothetical protein
MRASSSGGRAFWQGERVEVFGWARPRAHESSQLPPLRPTALSAPLRMDSYHERSPLVKPVEAAFLTPGPSGFRGEEKVGKGHILLLESLAKLSLLLLQSAKHAGIDIASEEECDLSVSPRATGPVGALLACRLVCCIPICSPRVSHPATLVHVDL